MTLPKTCFDCKLLDKTSLDKQGNPTLFQNAIPVLKCNRTQAHIAFLLAKTQPVCLEDTTVVTPEHQHPQDVTPQ